MEGLALDLGAHLLGMFDQGPMRVVWGGDGDGDGEGRLEDWLGMAAGGSFRKCQRRAAYSHIAGSMRGGAWGRGTVPRASEA